MKHLKSLGPIMMAIAVAAAFGAAGASATELYNGATTMGSGKTLDFSLKSGTKSVMTETGGSTVSECSGSTLQTKLTNAGSSTTTATSETTAATWSGCTFPTTTVTKGKLEFHQIAGTTNARVTIDAEYGATITTVFFGSCVFGAIAGTDIGILTNGTPATIDANAVTVKLSGSAFACPETYKWTATYQVTEPATNLRVEAS